LKNRELNELFRKFKDHKVLILGDVMVDSYVWGRVSRVSPEAPVPVVMQLNTENRLGGAANVALNIKSLGATPIMCSVIGKDENGKLFRDLITRLNMPEDGLIESSERITTNKTRIIAGHQQLLRVDSEVEHYIGPDLETALWEKIQGLIAIGDISAIIFQDYDKGVITVNLIEKTIELAKSRKIPTLVDPKKRNFSHYHHATLFKPNFKELVEGMKTELGKSDFAKIHEAAQRLQTASGFEMVLITLSEQGMLISQGNTFHVVPTHAHEVSDVSGAGDTVIAMASLCLAAGLDSFQLARLSNLAAGLVCEKIGVVPVEQEWMLNAGFTW
jgi:rfaE bifunctional protein kinase chain/domain